MDNFSKGIIKDTSPLSQPQGSVRYANNMIWNDVDGGIGSVATEPGNTLCHDYGVDSVILGTINVGKNETVVFTNEGTTSKIHLLSNCQNTELVSSECLPFSREYNITGVLYTNDGCERRIIFGDGNMPDMQLDLDSLDNYYTDEYITFLATGTGTFTGEVWDCNKFLLEPEYAVAQVSNVTTLDTGGNLPLGSYWFALKYTDSSGNETPYFHISNKAIVIDENSSTSPYYLDGGFNIEYFGEIVGGVPVTNKSLRLNITGIDTTYDQLHISVIRAVTGDGITRDAFNLIPIDITGSSMQYVYDGYHVTQEDLQNITVDPVFYTSSHKRIVIGDRLVRANVKERYYDWSRFQVAANNIRIRWTKNRVDTPYPDNWQNPEESPLFRDNVGVYTNMSQQADEIAAYGVRFLLTSGQYTPVFHIPGRDTISDATLISEGNSNTHNRNQVSSTDWDKQLLTVVDPPSSVSIIGDDEVTINNVEHLDVNVGDTIERWKVYNTAIEVSGSQYGYMGYHEGVTLYPDTLDCDGTPIYPHVNNGDGTFTMLPVRHHRLPDRTLVPLTYFESPTGDIKYQLLHLYVDQVQYPSIYADEIVGWEILQARQSELDKTVVASGIIEKCVHGRMEYPAISNTFDPAEDDITDTFIVQSPYYNYDNNGSQTFSPGFQLAGTNAIGYPDLTTIQYEGDTYFSLYTPEGLFSNSEVQGDYIKIEGKSTGIVETYDYETIKSNKWNTIVDERWYTSSLDLGIIQPETNVRLSTRKIHDSVYLGFQDTRPQGGATPTYKSYANQGNQIIKLNEDSNLTDLDNPNTEDIGNDEGYLYPQSPSDNSIYTHVTVKRVRPNVYADIVNLEYLRINPTVKTGESSRVSGGWVHTDKLGVRKTMATGDVSYSFRNIGKSYTLAGDILSGIGDVFTGGLLFGPKNEFQRVIHGHLNFHTESQINFGLRHQGLLLDRIYTEEDSTSGRGNADEVNQDNVNSYWPKTHGISGMSNYMNLPSNFLNFFVVNPDYSMKNDLKKFNPVLTELCIECEFTNRIIWSPTGSPDINLALDSKDITRNRGEIVDIVPYKGSVLIRTEKSLFRVPDNSQRLQATENTIDVTSGDFLSLDPEELIETETGYIGCSGEHQTVVTEYGVFMVDDTTGQVFRFNGQLENISNAGLQKWFRDNARLNKDKQYAIGSPNQIGTYLYYDPLLNRIFVTRKNTTDDGSHDHFNLSFDCNLNFWDSYHSYIPDFAFRDERNFYTTIDKYSIYKHEKDANWGIFYGNVSLPVFEMTSSTGVDSFLDSVYLVMDHIEDTPNGKVVKNHHDGTFFTFIRNTTQGSGIQPITADSQDYYRQNDGVIITKRANWYSMSGFRDLYDTDSSLPLVYTDRDYIGNNPVTQSPDQGYDDLVPSIGYKDGSDMYNSNFRFRDKFHIIRLYIGTRGVDNLLKTVIYFYDTVKQNAII